MSRVSSINHPPQPLKISFASQSFVLGIVLLFFFGCQRDTGHLVVSGRVEVDDVHVGSKIGGRIWKVHYEEGDDVKAGEAIVTLEDRELVAQLNQAKAGRDQARANLDLLLVGTRAEDIARAEAVVEARSAELALRRKGFRDEEVREAEAQLASARSDLEYASTEYKRTLALFQKGATERRDLDNKRTLFETAGAKAEIASQRLMLFRSGSRPEEITMAEAQLNQARADLERLRNGARPEEIAAQRAALEAAEANVTRLETQLEETRILAPVDCMVETLDLEPGDLVKAGEAVAVLNLKNSPWVRCYVPENRLGWVGAGELVDVMVDSFPGEPFEGKVRRINSEAEFTPRNVQTTEKRSELVFEMKVDILSKGELLRAGMYADVHIRKKP
ncbi:MAG: HlyD family efflux transporter periplasmic adaptor subunit [Candidatus Omnitrophica bacterium COP1]|nr:HlyD family efflux transporter periplasmic adaptor subunit [Candidatus Omnitrophica bacterium COP1]